MVKLLMIMFMHYLTRSTMCIALYVIVSYWLFLRYIPRSLNPRSNRSQHQLRLLTPSRTKASPGASNAILEFYL
jgi:hypothetical protein